MVRCIAFLVVAMVGSFVMAEETGSFNDPKLTAVESKMVEQINAFRAKHGRSALEIDLTLIDGTRRHAHWMATFHNMSHARGFRENIAMGQATVSACITTWINSGGHRANLLANGTKVGVAAYCRPGGRIFWCYRIR